jgi:hypothetical protein
VRPLIESLTPEQRQKVQRFLERRGATGLWLSRRAR